MTTYHLGLIGFPLTHTLSPIIHAAALRACGLQGSYLPFTIPPHDKTNLQAILHRIRTGSMHGLNVTIPHKQTVIEYLDELTPTAQTIGAVNTIYLREGKLIGDNTDAPGFLTDLKRVFEFPASRRSALVLGAGGSARAVVYALLTEGWTVTVAARRRAQAEELASSFPNFPLHITDFSSSLLSPFALIVNTTPVGMTPNIDLSPFPENITLPKDSLIYDLIYNPRETKLVRDARAKGIAATTGLGMLIEQAALSFQLWTGHLPPRKDLWQAAENNLPPSSA